METTRHPLSSLCIHTCAHTKHKEGCLKGVRAVHIFNVVSLVASVPSAVLAVFYRGVLTVANRVAN